LVGKHICTIVICIRNVVYCIIGRIVGRTTIIHCCRTIAWWRNNRDGAHTWAVTAEVIITQYCDIYRHVLVGRRHIIYCIWQIVHRINIYIDRRLITVTIAIAYLVHNRIRTIVVHIWCVVDRIIGRIIWRTAIIHYSRTIAWWRDDRDRAHARAVTAEVIIR